MALPSVDELLPEFEVRIGVPAGSLTGVQKERAQACLQDASDLVTAAAGSGLAVPPQPVAVTITLSAARRGYLNPGGVSSETVGPYSVKYSESSESGVYLTEPELRALRTMGSHGLWTLRTHRDEYSDTLWVHDDLPGGPEYGDAIAFETIPLQ